MQATFKVDPFPHVLIADFYTPEECVDVQAELKSLSNVLTTPDRTESAWTVDENNNRVYKKNNLGVMLSTVYQNSMSSAILRASRKLFDQDFMAQCKAFAFVFGYLPMTNWDGALVQFYADGQYYKPHQDSMIYTAVTNFSSEPKEYTGGLLKFVDYDYTIDLQRNECILFPSFVMHEVTPVSLNTTDLMKSRITITSFIGFRV